MWVPFLAVLLLSCQKNGGETQTADGTAARPASAGLEVKDRFGEGMTFPHLAVADYLGNRYDLFNLLNRRNNIVLVIDASCAACGEEGEKIQYLLQANRQVNVIGVSKDSLPAILNFKKRYHLFFPILQDIKAKLVPDYRRVFFPTLVLVGPDKKIIKLYEGQIPPGEAGPFLKAVMGL